MRCVFFFFNDTATTEIYTLSLHDALPIFKQTANTIRSDHPDYNAKSHAAKTVRWDEVGQLLWGDRKSTRLNSSHSQISYAVFCLKKKKNNSAERQHPASYPLTHTPYSGSHSQPIVHRSYV